MNVLILGGNGFIGSHLVDKHLSEGHNVRVFDKYEEHFRKPLKNVDYRIGDFGNRGMVGDILKGVDILYHLIWSSLPKTSNDDPSFDVQSNVIETINLLDKCVENSIKKFIFISSGGTVYGSPDILPIPEFSKTNPECSYGITKLAVEKFILLYNKLYNQDYIIARPSNPYGPRQDPYGIQGAIAVFLGKIKNNEPIEIWGNGEIVRDYIYIDDLINGLYIAAMSNTSNKIYNFGSGKGHSLNDVVDIIKHIVGNNIRINYKDKRSFDIQNIYLDVARAKEELGWEPVVPLNHGIKNTWEFVKSLK